MKFRFPLKIVYNIDHRSASWSNHVNHPYLRYGQYLGHKATSVQNKHHTYCWRNDWFSADQCLLVYPFPLHRNMTGPVAYYSNPYQCLSSPRHVRTPKQRDWWERLTSWKENLCLCTQSSSSLLEVIFSASKIEDENCCPNFDVRVTGILTNSWHRQTCLKCVKI